jgi:hypothetical protein
MLQQPILGESANILQYVSSLKFYTIVFRSWTLQANIDPALPGLFRNSYFQHTS